MCTDLRNHYSSHGVIVMIIVGASFGRDSLTLTVSLSSEDACGVVEITFLQHNEKLSKLYITVPLAASPPTILCAFPTPLSTYII